MSKTETAPAAPATETPKAQTPPAQTPEAKSADKKSVAGKAIWMGTAVGVGSAAIVAALLYAKRR